MKEIIIEEMTKDLMNEKLTLTDIDNVTGGTICDIENLDNRIWFVSGLADSLNEDAEFFAHHYIF